MMRTEMIWCCMLKRMDLARHMAPPRDSGAPADGEMTGVTRQGAGRVANQRPQRQADPLPVGKERADDVEIARGTGRGAHRPTSRLSSDTS
jgi:hypothetical protein